MAETAPLVVKLDLIGNLTSGIAKATRQIAGLEKGVGRTGKGIGQLGAGFARAGLVVGGAAVAGLTAAAKAAIDYEDAFSGVRKTVEASESELAALSDQFRDMAKEIPIAATEFARLGEIAGALGIKTDAIDEFARTTALLGVTTDLTADAAADALGRIGNILNLTADDYDNFGSALVNLGNKGASTEPEIIEITKRFAAAGKQAGLATTDILGLAEAAASFTGLAPEAAGSSLSRLAGTLTKVVAGGGKKFEVLNKIAGTDFRKALDKDASGALLRFLKGLGKLDKYERASALKTLGLDSVYLRQLLGGLIENIDGVELSLANAEAGWKGNFLNEEAAKKFDTIASKLQVLKNNFVDAGITIGEGFLPALGRTTDKLIAFLKVDANQSALKAIGEDIGKALDSIDWKQVLDGAKSFVGVLKSTLSITLDILSAINKLPNEVKAAAAALLVLNKASGGLIGAGVGNVAGGIAETAIRGLGSKLPKVGSLFAQPVFVTNWPMGGLGGGLGGAAGAAGAVGWGASIAGALSVAAPAIGVALASNFATEVANKELGTNFLAPGTGGVGPMAIVAAIHNLGEVIKFGQPKPPAPIVNVTVDNRGHEGAGFRPKPAGAPANPFARPDRDDAVKAAINNTTTAVETMKGNIGFKVDKVATNTVAAGVAAKNASMETKATVASGTMIQAALMGSQIATTLTSAYGTQGAVRSVAPPIVGAIRAIPRPVTYVNVNVTATHVTKSTTIQNRYGSGGGSGSQNARPGDSGV